MLRGFTHGEPGSGSRVRRMALYHDATVSPTKAELLSQWVPTQPWSSATGDVELIGAFRFDDPAGEVGMESFLVSMDGVVLHVPVTYRSEPLEGAEAALITEMHHTALGTRWVYDGIGDDRYLTMLAAVAMTGQGEALGMVQYDGLWHIAPSAIRLEGGGWTQERVSVHGFTTEDPAAEVVVCRNDGFDLQIHRRPALTERPPLGLSARWADQPNPVLLATVHQR